MDFLLSKQGQEIIAQEGTLPVRPDVKVPAKFNLADTLKVLREPDTYTALLNSLFIASGVTVMSTVIGTFFAWLVTRTDLPFKPAMRVLFLVPFMLPSFISRSPVRSSLSA